MEWYKVAFGDIYPLVYPHRDDAEATRVAQSLAPLLGKRSPVLDLACGNGRYMTAFARAGFDMVGVDLSPYLLADAVTSRALQGLVAIGDMRELPFRSQSMGAVVNMFTSFGYFETDLDNVRVMHEAARVTMDGGVFLMDFLNVGVLERELANKQLSTRSERGATIDEEREIVDGGRVLVKRVRVRMESRAPLEYSERLRLYRYDDLVAMAETAGLSPRAVYGGYQLSPYEPASSPRVIMVFTKGDASS